MIVRKGRGQRARGVEKGGVKAQIKLGYIVRARYLAKAWRTVKGESMQVDVLKTKTISERFMSMSAAETYAALARKAHPEYEAVWATEDFGEDDL